MKWEIHDIVHVQCIIQCKHACFMLRVYYELSVYDLKKVLHHDQLCTI